MMMMMMVMMMMMMMMMLLFQLLIQILAATFMSIVGWVASLSGLNIFGDKRQCGEKENLHNISTRIAHTQFLPQATQACFFSCAMIFYLKITSLRVDFHLMLVASLLE